MNFILGRLFGKHSDVEPPLSALSDRQLSRRLHKLQNQSADRMQVRDYIGAGRLSVKAAEIQDEIQSREHAEARSAA
jgi:hypothetical protein